MAQGAEGEAAVRTSWRMSKVLDATVQSKVKAEWGAVQEGRRRGAGGVRHPRRQVAAWSGVPQLANGAAQQILAYAPVRSIRSIANRPRAIGPIERDSASGRPACRCTQSCGQRRRWRNLARPAGQSKCGAGCHPAGRPGGSSGADQRSIYRYPAWTRRLCSLAGNSGTGRAAAALGRYRTEAACCYAPARAGRSSIPGHRRADHDPAGGRP